MNTAYSTAHCILGFLGFAETILLFHTAYVAMRDPPDFFGGK